MKHFQIFILLSFFLITSLSLFSQDIIDDEKRRGRNLHATLGPFSSINYDQKIIGARNVDHSLIAGVQANMLTDFNLLNFNFNNIFRFNLYVAGLLGKGSSFVELGLGQGVVFGTGRPQLRIERETRMFLGYRHKFETLLFRAGIGYPELLYVGGGIRF